MKKSLSIALLWSLALCPAAALAQPVFFDDFDGSELLPHWGQPDPSRLEYNVSGGMLHVTELLFPSVAKLEANFAIIGARYTPQTDFRMDVWMGWENPTEPWNELRLTAVGPSGELFANFGMRHLVGEPPEIIAGVTTGFVAAPAPPPGMYQFTIARTGSQFDFYLDGDPFGSLPDTFGIPAAGVSIFFSKPFPGEMNPYHIDRIRVIPAPGALISFAPAALACAARGRACATIPGDCK